MDEFTDTKVWIVAEVEALPSGNDKKLNVCIRPYLNWLGGLKSPTEISRLLRCPISDRSLYIIQQVSLIQSLDAYNQLTPSLPSIELPGPFPLLRLLPSPKPLESHTSEPCPIPGNTPVQSSQCFTDPIWLYFEVKGLFTGYFIGSIFYGTLTHAPTPPSHHARSIQSLGIVAALFSQFMSVLLIPVNPIRRAVNWSLVVHAMATFAFLTIPWGSAYIIYRSSIYIESFPATTNTLPDLSDTVSSLTPRQPAQYSLLCSPWTSRWPLGRSRLGLGRLGFSRRPLIQLYQCYVIYFMDRWVMAFRT